MPKVKKQKRSGHPVRIPKDLHAAIAAWANDNSRGFTLSITEAYRILLTGALNRRHIPVGEIDVDGGATSRRVIRSEDK